VESVTRLGTVEGLDTEAARARRTLVDAVAGRVRGEPAPEVPQRRSCSLVAHAATEDPIGTARPFDRYLMLELPLPWPPGMGTPVWETDRVLAPLRAALRRATRRTEELGLTMKTFAAAPDPEYSTPRLMRVIRFGREPGPAAGLTRTEHSVPDTLAADLVDALFDDDPAALAPFAESRDTTPRRDLVVCTHASVDACCGTFGYPLYEALRREHGSTGNARVWRISSFGGHRFAPTLVDLPEGRYWGNLTPERLSQLVHRTGHPSELMDCYRGWGCLSRPADQVLERELFRKHGWNWIGQRLELEPADGDITRVATHDPRSENTQHYDAVLRHLGAEPVLVGCDGTAGEVQRYEASLHLREPAAQQ
jgi:hypothetical protein